MDLSSREIATIFWAFIALFFVFKTESTRKALLSVFKALFIREVLFLLLLMFLYIALLLMALTHFSLWEFFLPKEIFYWIFGTAFVFLMNVFDSNSEDYLRKTLIETLKLLVGLTFLANFYTFNIFIELALLPIITLVVAMGAFAEDKKEYATIKKFSHWILTLFGLGIIIFFLTKMTTNATEFFTTENFYSFILPFLFTVLYIPFLYSFRLYALYENLFLRISLLLRRNTKLQHYLKRQVLILSNINLIKLQKFSKYSASKLLELKNESDVRRMLRDFKMTN